MLIKKPVYELPIPGEHIGVIADVVDLGMVQTLKGLFPKVQIIWFLKAVDSKGKQFRIQSTVNQSLNEKSTLYGIIKGVFGKAPNVSEFETDHLLGRNNRLYIAIEGEYANVKVINPLQPGDVPATVPADYIRKALRSAQPGQQAAPVATSPAITSTPVEDIDIPF